MGDQFNVSASAATSEYGVDSSKCVESPGFSHFYVHFPCNPLIEDYTQIFYMIDKGDIPSIQCKMNLKGLKSIRKVDGMSFIFIDFYGLFVESVANRNVNFPLNFQCHFTVKQALEK
jgi:hypothetical protein